MISSKTHDCRSSIKAVIIWHHGLLAPNPFISSVLNLQIVALHACYCLTLMCRKLWLIIDLRFEAEWKWGHCLLLCSLLFFFSPVAEHCHNNMSTSIFDVFSAAVWSHLNCKTVLTFFEIYRLSKINCLPMHSAAVGFSTLLNIQIAIDQKSFHAIYGFWWCCFCCSFGDFY